MVIIYHYPLHRHEEETRQPATRQTGNTIPFYEAL